MQNLAVTKVDDRGFSVHHAPLRLITMKTLESGGKRYRTYKYWDDAHFKDSHAAWGDIQEGDVVTGGLVVLDARKRLLKGVPVITRKPHGNTHEPTSVEGCEECRNATKNLMSHLNEAHQVRLV